MHFVRHAAEVDQPEAALATYRCSSESSKNLLLERLLVMPILHVLPKLDLCTRGASGEVRTSALPCHPNCRWAKRQGSLPNVTA